MQKIIAAMTKNLNVDKTPKQTRRGHCKSLVAEPFGYQALWSTTLLDFIFGEVLYAPFHSNKTRITRVCLPAGRQGSVPVEPA